MASTRGRRRKGNTRMDAALDAMAFFGFSEDLVKKTVAELLNVYGGKEGWVFVEEASYTLLIEAILEKQNNLAQQEDKLSQASAAGSSNVIQPLCPNTEAMGASSQTNQDKDSALQTVEAPVTALVIHQSDGMHSVPQEANSDGMHSLPQEANSGNGETADNNLTLSCSPYPLSSVDSFPGQRRRPYHGWVGDDDGELELPSPAPFEESLEKMFVGLDRRSKRKTRWDARPEDP